MSVDVALTEYKLLNYLHVEVGIETLWTVRALEPLYSLVDLHVLIEVCFLCKAYPAVSERACIWFFISMDP